APRLATSCPRARSRDEQFAGADQIAGRKFGNFTSPPADAARLERRRRERIKINRGARGFVEPIHAVLYAARAIAAAANGRCRSWRAAATRSESRAATQSANCSRTQAANERRRGADRTGPD